MIEPQKPRLKYIGAGSREDGLPVFFKHTDASFKGLASVLGIENSNSKRYPGSFFRFPA